MHIYVVSFLSDIRPPVLGLSSKHWTKLKTGFLVVVFLLIICFVALSQLQPALAQSSEGSLVVLPLSIDVVYPNSFTVDVQVQDVVNLTWVGFRLAFDHNLMSFEDYVYENGLDGGCAQQSPGVYTCSGSTPGTTVVSGTVTFLTVTFHCLAGGSSSISIPADADWLRSGGVGVYIPFAQLGAATVNQVVPLTVTTTSNFTTTTTIVIGPPTITTTETSTSTTPTTTTAVTTVGSTSTSVTKTLTTTKIITSTATQARTGIAYSTTTVTQTRTGVAYTTTTSIQTKTTIGNAYSTTTAIQTNTKTGTVYTTVTVSATQTRTGAVVYVTDTVTQTRTGVGYTTVTSTLTRTGVAYTTTTLMQTSTEQGSGFFIIPLYTSPIYLAGLLGLILSFRGPWMSFKRKTSAH
jgi:hypothetical protein